MIQNSSRGKGKRGRGRRPKLAALDSNHLQKVFGGLDLATGKTGKWALTEEQVKTLQEGFSYMPQAKPPAWATALVNTLVGTALILSVLGPPITQTVKEIFEKAGNMNGNATGTDNGPVGQGAYAGGPTGNSETVGAIGGRLLTPWRNRGIQDVADAEEVTP